MTTRPPAVAGAFYPGVARQLEADVTSMLAAAEAATPGDEEPATGEPPKALIVPHAGYVYSGPTAARAYTRLRDRADEIRRVVLLGPAHRVPIRGLAAPQADAFQTPLGSIPIDRDGIEALRDLPQVTVSDHAHALEHSLEVQLPFLQRVLAHFVLLPLVVGDADDAEVAEVIERVWGGPETLIVVSSDLSHYYDYETARRLDDATRRAIEALDGEALDWESACGRVPVRGLIEVARRRDLVARTLDLRSSGDTAGDRDRVVGYGAFSFAPRSAQPHSAQPHSARPHSARPHSAQPHSAQPHSAQPHSAQSHDATLLEIARASIEHGLDTGRPLDPDVGRLPAALREPGACFVTLRGPDGALRGCIGSLEATRTVAADVAHNAFAAAFRDPRMQPVERAEWPDLHLSISLLGPREPIEADSLSALIAALRPGIDGLALEDGRHRGTLLPQVWRELPDPRDFVATVWQKAGLPGDHWSPTVRAWRYTVREIEPSVP